jgi:hypothetical protein
MISGDGWLSIGISHYKMKLSICITGKTIFLGPPESCPGFKKTVLLIPENDKLSRENYPF